MIEDVEDNVEEPPDLDFYKATVRLFDEIYNGKDGVLPLS